MSHLSPVNKVLRWFNFPLASLAMALLLLPGCVPLLFFGAGVGTIDMATQERGLGAAATDGQIRAQINGYWFDQNIDLYRDVLLAVQDGRVMVMGYVPTEAVRAKAVELAWQATGVKEVINEILVGPQPSPASSFEDVWISTKIRTLMLTTQDFPSNNYSITTLNGVVYLLGISTNPSEQNEALEICKSTRGVTKVVNHLLLKAQVQGKATPKAESQGFSSHDNPISSSGPEEEITAHPQLTKEEAHSYLSEPNSPGRYSKSSSGIHEESLAPPSF